MLAVEGLSHSFGPTQALKGVSFAARAGRVLAVVGENGSGKSTLMRALAGELRPNAGKLRWDGSPLDSSGIRVFLVHQELAICPDLTAAENIFLGDLKGTRFSPKAVEAHAKAILETMGFPEFEPSALAGELPISQRQILEIARAEARCSPIILLDEPTSSLTEADKRNLYDLIDRLKTSGKTIIFISHFLEEIREVADDIIILRDGEKVAEGLVAEMSDNEIVKHMVGRDVGELFPRSDRPIGDVILEIRDLEGQDAIPTSANLSVRRGEVVGIAGLNGAGRTELLRTVFGLRSLKCGVVSANDNHSLSPRQHWSSRTGFVSEERKDDGLSVDLSVAENVTMPTRRGFLHSPKVADTEADRWIRDLGIKCDDPEQPIASLSGGNQQKVAFARLLQSECELFLLDEPTRGIDVASKVELYRQIDEAACRGCGVLMASSYLPELFGVCDRIAVMNRGRLVSIHDARVVSPGTVMKECAL